MLHSHVITLIDEAERRFPVDRWMVDGVHVWPLVRISLGDVLTLDPQLDMSVAPRGQTIFDRAATKARSAMTYLYSRFADGASSVRPTGARAAVFVSKSFVRSCVEGRWYDRYCWPLISCFERSNRPTLLLEDIHPGKPATPRAHPAWFTNPTLGMAAWRARVEHKLQMPQDAQLDQYDEFLSWVASISEAHRSLQKSWLVRCVREVLALSRFYRTIFAETRPEFAFVVCYWSLPGLALSHACRQAGVVSVDIQHGVAGDRMYPYSPWNRTPPGGFSVLPHVFLCWSDVEARIAGGAATVVGGNLWTRNWEVAFGDAARRDGAELSALRSDDRMVVLYLSQTESDLPPHVAEAIRTSPDGVSWWYRQHPADVVPPAQVAARLRALTGRRIEVSAPSARPLPAVLSRVDLVVSRYSSALLDALDAGKPAVVASREGDDLFACYRQDPGLTTALSGDELASRIRQGLDGRADAPARRDAVDVDAVLAELDAVRRRVLHQRG